MAQVDYQNKSFLIIDDFVSFQKIIKTALQELNAHKIDTAVNAAKAIKACEERQYDVIFCDFDLGKGSNGLQLFEELQHRNLLKSSAVYIMVTAETSRDAVVGSLEYKPDAYLNKPVSSGELKSRLVKSLGQKEALMPLYNALDAEDYQKVMSLCDKNISEGNRHKNWCLKTKGQVLQKLARWGPAQDLYETVLAERPLFWAQIGYAQVLAAQKMHEQALQAFKRCYEDNSHSLESYEGAARMLIELGETKEAQKLLSQVSNISSRSVSRQRLLAEVCNMNGDFEGAADAFKKVVHLAEESFHKSSQNEIDYADNLTEAALHSSDDEKTKEFAQKALNQIRSTQNEYKDDDSTLQNKLIESRAYSSINNKEESDKSLKEAEQKIQSGSGNLSIRTQLELAKSYLQAGEKEKAIDHINDLAELYKDDPVISARLDRIFDDPVSAEGKAKVGKINKEGIKLFNDGDYINSAKCFIKATTQFPKHIGIRLNIIQAYLYKMKESKPSKEYVEACKHHLSSIKNMKVDHPQYKRYESFQSAVNTLQKHFS